MRARHKDAKGKQYSYEDHYEDDDFMDSYDDSYTPSMESRLVGPKNQSISFSIASEIPEDDNDLLNDCLDQIDDFIDGQIEYDEETVVEFLRSNEYNVEEAIDFIMENGPGVATPIMQPVLPKQSLPTNTLASVIGKKPLNGNVTKQLPQQTVYTIEEDLLHDINRFDFKSLSPDDYVKKMQDEGKTRQQSSRGLQEESSGVMVSEFPHSPKPSFEKSHSPKDLEKSLQSPKPSFEKSPRSPKDLEKSLQSPKPSFEKSPRSPKDLEKSPQSPKPSFEKSPRSPRPTDQLPIDSTHSPLTSSIDQFETTMTKSPSGLIEGKDRITVVITGHVDHGKSTITGHLLVQLGFVSEKELRKVTKEAKDYGKQSFNYAFLMDQNPEEREHGVTIDLGVIHLQTPHRHITLLDAPGHRDFISAMINGGQQADCGILVVSAQKGEFEAGVSEAGITKEHLLILAGSGIERLIILVNKMDTWNFDKDRYEEIVKYLIPYLKHLGFKKQNVTFIPVSGLEGVNLCSVHNAKCPWYTGKSLMEELDVLTPTPAPSTLQDTNDVVMMVTDVFHGDYLGDCIAARVIRGFVDMNALKPLMFLPSKLPLQIKNLYVHEAKTTVATVNTNVVLSLQDANFQLVTKGHIITPTYSPIIPTNRIVAHMYVNEIINRPVMKGLTVILHLAGSSVTAVIQHVLALIDSTGKVLQNKPKLVRGGQWVSVELALQHEVYVAPVSKIPHLGRFIIRCEGQTLGIGRVMELKPSKYHKFSIV